MRRRISLVVAMAVLVAGGGGAVAGGQSPSRPIAPRNEIIAKLDAEAHLSDLALPASAGRSDREPAGDGGALAHPFSPPPPTPDVVDYHLWWVVLGESPAALLQYVQDHPPTGVRADSQVVWIKVRSPSERIPLGSRRLVLTTRRFGRVIQGPITVRSRGAIRRATRLLNVLPAAQPGAIACPLDWGSQIRLAFYLGETVRPSAVAVIDPSGCGLVRLTIRGRRQPPLSGGFVLARRLGRALGIKLDTGNPAPR